MSEILLVNPKSRRRHKRRRSAAQKAATRKMLAARFGKRTAARAHVNPIKRRRRHHVHHAHAMHHRRRRYRLNPRGGGVVGMLTSTLVPAAMGAVGGLGVNILIGFLPLPAMLKTGMMRTVTTILGAVGLGAVVSMVSSRRTGELVAAGAVTVTLYDALKGIVVRTFPQIPLEPTATVVIPTAAATVAPGVPTGAMMGIPEDVYVDAQQGISWYNPAQSVGEVGYYVDGVDDGVGGAFVRAY